MRPTTTEKADFDRDGAVLMKGVVPAAWLGVLADAVERDIAEPGPYLQRLPAGSRALPRQFAHLGDA